MLYPVDDPVEAVEVKPADLARLDPEEFLNDTVIDFFIKCVSLLECLFMMHIPKDSTCVILPIIITAPNLK